MFTGTKAINGVSVITYVISVFHIRYNLLLLPHLLVAGVSSNVAY